MTVAALKVELPALSYFTGALTAWLDSNVLDLGSHHQRVSHHLASRSSSAGLQYRVYWLVLFLTFPYTCLYLEEVADMS